MTTGSAVASASQNTEMFERPPESRGTPSEIPESLVVGPASPQAEEPWPAYELADDLTEQSAEIS